MRWVGTKCTVNKTQSHYILASKKMFKRSNHPKLGSKRIKWTTLVLKIYVVDFFGIIFDHLSY